MPSQGGTMSQANGAAQRGRRNGTAAPAAPAAPVPPALPTPLEVMARPTLTLPVPTPVRLPPHSSRHRRAKNNLKLTDAVAEKIMAAKRGGGSDQMAAQWAGIDAGSLSHWRHRPGEPYDTFRRLLGEAEAYPKLYLLDAVYANAHLDPKTALELLSRLEPETYGKVVVLDDRTRPPGMPPEGAAATGVLALGLGAVLEQLYARRLGGGPAGVLPALPPKRGKAAPLPAPSRPRDPRPPKGSA